jgi:RNA polymerase sigma factor (sigma-70 family)
MIPSWLRALVGAGKPGRPSRTPTVRHRPRTILRLEAVEDRTVASAVAAEPPPALLHAAVPSSDAPSKPTDQPKPPTDKNADGSTTDQSADGQDTSAADTPVLMVGSAPADMQAVSDSTVMAAPGPRTAALLSDHFEFGTSSSDAEPSSTSTSAKESVRTTSTTDPTGLTPTAQTAGSATTIPNDRGPDGSAPTTVNVTPAAVVRSAANGTAGNGPIAAAPTTSTQLSADAPGKMVTGGRAAANASTGLLNGVSDGNLLQRFVANRDQTAFAALVQRYGGMVLGVCQKVIGDYHAAQDASQATFMVLARKAGMLDRSTPLGGWLYKVAYHIALRSRGVAAKQRLGEKQAADELPIATTDTGPVDVEQGEVHQVLREELQGLPEKYRAPLTLCYVDGRSHADAAKEIGLPRGSMAKRVGEGLERLRERLLHRGVAL